MAARVATLFVLAILLAAGCVDSSRQDLGGATSEGAGFSDSWRWNSTERPERLALRVEVQPVMDSTCRLSYSFATQSDEPSLTKFVMRQDLTGEFRSASFIAQTNAGRVHADSHLDSDDYMEFVGTSTPTWHSEGFMAATEPTRGLVATFFLQDLLSSHKNQPSPRFALNCTKNPDHYEVSYSQSFHAVHGMNLDGGTSTHLCGVGCTTRAALSVDDGVAYDVDAGEGQFVGFSTGGVRPDGSLTLYHPGGQTTWALDSSILLAEIWDAPGSYSAELRDARITTPATPGFIALAITQWHQAPSLALVPSTTADDEEL